MFVQNLARSDTEWLLERDIMLRLHLLVVMAPPALGGPHQPLSLYRVQPQHDVRQQIPGHGTALWTKDGAAAGQLPVASSTGPLWHAQVGDRRAQAFRCCSAPCRLAGRVVPLSSFRLVVSALYLPF